MLAHHDDGSTDIKPEGYQEPDWSKTFEDKKLTELRITIEVGNSEGDSNNRHFVCTFSSLGAFVSLDVARALKTRHGKDAVVRLFYNSFEHILRQTNKKD